MPIDFHPIGLDDQDRYLRRLARCAQHPSDYSFVNLWGWALEYGLEWAWTDDLVFIRQQKPRPCYWAPIGDWAETDWPSALASLSDSPITFTRVPEYLARQWEAAFPGSIQVTDARGDWDYLYDAADLIALRGNRFHKKKNLLNQFLKAYAAEYVRLTPSVIDEAAKLQMEWCEWRDCESMRILAAENRAIERVFDAWSTLRGLVGGGIRVDGRMVAYTVGEQLSDNTIVIHFEKGNPEYKGVYQAINQMFLANLTDDRIQWVNREQDLDDPGLRKAKMSYNPADFLRKYRVTMDT
jgi:uncharacterized protein